MHVRGPERDEVRLEQDRPRELTVTGGNASTPASWRQAMRLVEASAVDVQWLVSEVVPLVERERAFAATRSGRGIQFVLDPR